MPKDNPQGHINEQCIIKTSIMKAIKVIPTLNRKQGIGLYLLRRVPRLIQAQSNDNQMIETICKIAFSRRERC